MSQLGGHVLTLGDSAEWLIVAVCVGFYGLLALIAWFRDRQEAQDLLNRHPELVRRVLAAAGKEVEDDANAETEREENGADHPPGGAAG